MASTNIANQLTSTTTDPNLPPPAEEQISNRCIGLRGEHYVVFIVCLKVYILRNRKKEYSRSKKWKTVPWRRNYRIASSHENQTCTCARGHARVLKLAIFFTSWTVTI